MTGEDQGERYRQAAEDAPEQLDWCIGYLHGIHKAKDLQAAGEKPHIHQTKPDAGTD